MAPHVTKVSTNLRLAQKSQHLMRSSVLRTSRQSPRLPTAVPPLRSAERSELSASAGHTIRPNAEPKYLSQAIRLLQHCSNLPADRAAPAVCTTPASVRVDGVTGEGVQNGRVVMSPHDSRRPTPFENAFRRTRRRGGVLPLSTCVQHIDERGRGSGRHALSRPNSCARHSNSPLPASAERQEVSRREVTARPRRAKSRRAPPRRARFAVDGQHLLRVSDLRDQS